MILEVPIRGTFKVQLQGQREMVSSFFSDLELFDHPVSMFKRIYFNMGLNHLK